MPKCCGYCPFEYKNYCMAKPSLMVESADRHPRCPLIPVPTHGRMIDADALEVHEGFLIEAEGYRTHISFVYSNDVYGAPTIIPSDHASV